jgi:TusA-related sulfurtransferase
MTEHRLDITSEVCPMTFVKTKLLLERMAPGDIAEVRLKGAEPRDNVPRSVRDHGHEVLALAADGDGETYLLRIRKR